MINPCVIIDTGAYEIRAGLATHDEPSVITPSLVGTPLNATLAELLHDGHDYYVGRDALQREGMLLMSEPVKGGVVSDWVALERLWESVVYRDLRIAPEEYTFVVAQDANCPRNQKEKSLEVLMESLRCQGAFLGSAAVFSLFCYGKTTGVVVDAGLDGTDAVPVHEGYPLTRHIARSSVGGAALTTRLCDLLRPDGHHFDSPQEVRLINDVKERLCYVTHDPSVEAAKPLSFQLPDGQSIPLGEQRWKCPEALFNCVELGQRFAPAPRVYTESGEEFTPTVPKGITWLAYAAANNCDASMTPALLNSVVLSGGTTLFRGVQSRMQRELVQLYREMHPKKGVTPMSVEDMPCRRWSAWLGGCILSSVDMFPHLTISRAEYEESGPMVAHQKNL